MKNCGAITRSRTLAQLSDGGPDRIRSQINFLQKFSATPTRRQALASLVLCTASVFRILSGLQKHNRRTLTRTAYCFCGPDRIRTRCLLSANEALYQVSYGPSEMGSVNACIHIYPSSWASKPCAYWAHLHGPLRNLSAPILPTRPG